MTEEEAYEADEGPDLDTINVTEYQMLCGLASSEELWKISAPLIKHTYFDKEFQPVVNFCQTYFDTYHALPKMWQIRAETGIKLESLAEDLQEEHVKEWLAKEIEVHCRDKALYEGLNSGIKMMNESDSRSTADVVRQNMQNVLNMSIHRDLGMEVHEDMMTALERENLNSGFKCGLTDIDEAFGGGFSKETVTTFSLASGQGKSVLLSNLANNYAKSMLNVVYITLELSETKVCRRFGAIMTGYDIHSTFAHKTEIGKELKMRMLGSTPKEGHIYLKKFSSNGTTVADIESYLHELKNRRKIPIHVLILDYLDLLTPKDKSVKIDNIHIRDRCTAIEFHDLVERHKLIGFTASQRTKGAEEASDDDPQGSMSGGTEKVNSTDNLVFGRRSHKDEALILTVKKSRDSGADGKKIPVAWNNNNLQITDASPELVERYKTMRTSDVRGGNRSYQKTDEQVEAQNVIKSLKTEINRRKPV